MNANSCDKHCIRTHFNTELDVLYPSLVRMRKVLVRPWVGVRVRHLLLLLFYIFKFGPTCFNQKFADRHTIRLQKTKRLAR